MAAEGPEHGAAVAAVRGIGIVVNGAPRLVSRDATIARLAEELGIARQARGIAIALDGVVVPRGRWAETLLIENARVEVVRASAGG